MFQLFQKVRSHYIFLFSLILSVCSTGCDQSFAPFQITEPTSYSGTLSCIDCNGVQVYLNLFPDSVYVKRSERMGEGSVEGEYGRWGLNSSRSILILRSSSGQVSYFSLSNNTRLIALNDEANPYQTSQPNHLTARNQFEWVDIDVRLKGEYLHLADSNVFTECTTKKSISLVANTHSLALERLYLQREDLDQKNLLVEVRGTLELLQNTERPNTVGLNVSEFEMLSDSVACSASTIKSDVFAEQWKLEWLNGVSEQNITLGNRPFLVFDSTESRVYGFSGCNSFSGAFSLENAKLRLSAIASTRKSCFPENNVENMLITAFEDVNFVEVVHPRLVFYDEERKTIARFSIQ